MDASRKRELLDAVYADPESDAARLVLADWLQENGDPRGELISLQLSRAAGTREGRAREKELLASGRKEWLDGVTLEDDRELRCLGKTMMQPTDFSFK